MNTRALRYATEEAALSLWRGRQAGMLSTLTIALALFVLGGFLLVTANLDHKLKINSDGVKLQTKKPTDVRVQQFVFEAGGYTGWHHHPGLVIIAVESGFDRLRHVAMAGGSSHRRVSSMRRCVVIARVSDGGDCQVASATNARVGSAVRSGNAAWTKF